MKIVSISEQHSKTGEIAFRTAPPINEAIYDKLLPAWRASQLLAGTPVKITGGLFIVRPSEITPELARAIQQLLDEAEQAVFRAEDEAREQAEVQRGEKRKTLEAAARIFGVEIQ